MVVTQWLKHAFAIPSAEAFVPTPDEITLVSRMAIELERRGLLLPAVVMLESLRPLGGVGAQTLWFSEPWFAALTNPAGLRVLAGLLERPGSVDWMVNRLQEADDNSAPDASGIRASASDRLETPPNLRSIDIDGPA